VCESATRNALVPGDGVHPAAAGGQRSGTRLVPGRRAKWRPENFDDVSLTETNIIVDVITCLVTCTTYVKVDRNSAGTCTVT